jgi:DNA-binding NtrC family response regulator
MPKVLIIDDDLLVCAVLTDCLADLPASLVACAPTGPLGAQKLRETHFDLALIDGVMPGLSGLELAEIAANVDTPVLLLSGHPEVHKKLDDYGYPYLAKPFSLDQLVAVSRRTVANARENIRRVKASTAQMRADAEGAVATAAQSKRAIG